MDESVIRHIEQVEKWLDENVQVFPEPNVVRLSGFSVNWDNFSGEFRVSFDSVVLSEKLRFGLDVSGKTTFYLPMFFSVLGGAGSHAAIDISESTYEAILKGLHETFPRLTGFGINRKTGKEITNRTPPIERTDGVLLKQAKNKITKGYSITITTKEVV